MYFVKLGILVVGAAPPSANGLTCEVDVWSYSPDVRWITSALVRRCCVERVVIGRADNRCRGQRRSIVLAVEVKGFMLVV